MENIPAEKRELAPGLPGARPSFSVIGIFFPASRATFRIERPIAPTIPVLVSNPYLIEMTGRNYQWRVRSPGADGVLNTADDLHSARDVLEMKGRFVVESRDVFQDRVRKESAACTAKLASQSERC